MASLICYSNAAWIVFVIFLPTLYWNFARGFIRQFVSNKVAELDWLFTGLVDTKTIINLVLASNGKYLSHHRNPAWLWWITFTYAIKIVLHVSHPKRRLYNIFVLENLGRKRQLLYFHSKKKVEPPVILGCIILKIMNTEGRAQFAYLFLCPKV